MIPQISKALSSGFTTNQIIRYLIKKFPQHANKINNALAAGFTVDQIVKYLGGGKKELNKMDFEPSEDEGMTPYAKTLNKDIKGQENRAKYATYGGMAAVSAPMAASALSRALPQNLLRLGQNTPQLQQTIQQTLQPPMGPGPNSPGVQVLNPKGPSPSPMPQGQQLGQPPINTLQPLQNLPTSQPPVNAPTIPQPSQPIQPQRDVKKSVDIIKSTGQEATVKNLLEGGLSPSAIKDTLGVILGKKKLKELEKETGGIEQAIEDYAQTVQAQNHEMATNPDKNIIENFERGFHQTTPEAEENILKEGFKISKAKSGIDPLLPEGIFLKPNDKDIGLEGKRQIETKYEKGKNISFTDREEVKKWLEKHDKYKIYNKKLEKQIEKYESLPEKIVDDESGVLAKNILRENGIYQKQINELISRGEKEYPHYPNYYLDEEAIKLIENQTEEIRKEGRDISTEIFKNAGYDSVNIKRDEAGPGQYTETNLILNPEKVKPIQKSETVSTPQGIGEVKEIRNGKAIVEVDGKNHQVDVEDLEKEPEDVIEEVQQLLKIPEVDRSSIVSLFTFDPEERKMYIQFHNGETYKYLDVDPEKVMKIANKMGIPVTKGKNIFGAWSPQDKKSLGATLIKEIINDPKYKKTKKGEEPNPNYVQLETLYDYWEKLRKKPKRKGL